MNEENIDELVEYIVGTPNHNVTEAARHFNCSRFTITKYLDMLSDTTSLYYNQFKAMRVKLTLEKLLLESRSKAGSISRRKACLTESQALEARFKNVYQKIPLRHLALEYHCSHMTIANAINNLSERAIQAQDEEVYLLRQKQKNMEKAIKESEKKWMR